MTRNATTSHDSLFVLSVFNRKVSFPCFKIPKFYDSRFFPRPNFPLKFSYMQTNGSH